MPAPRERDAMPEKRRHTRKPKHDASYKRIFAHSRTTADLLRGFVGDLAHHLDFATLERLPASFVTEHLGQRHADSLWKMQTVERRWLYLLVLLEFQSTVDSRMALRMLDYTIRVLQGLVRDELDPDGRFPPILPLVIYNGHGLWNAPTEVRDHFAPAPLELVGYLPSHRYLLLDLRALDPLLLPDLNIGTEEDGGMSSALAERVRKWGDELNRQWLEKGIRQGQREGIRQGQREGLQRERALVLRLVRRRFGSPVAEEFAPRLGALSDHERIASVADAVIESETAEEFLARAEKA